MSSCKPSSIGRPKCGVAPTWRLETVKDNRSIKPRKDRRLCSLVVVDQFKPIDLHDDMTRGGGDHLTAHTLLRSRLSATRARSLIRGRSGC